MIFCCISLTCTDAPLLSHRQNIHLYFSRQMKTIRPDCAAKKKFSTFLKTLASSRFSQKKEDFCERWISKKNSWKRREEEGTGDNGSSTRLPAAPGGFWIANWKFRWECERRHRDEPLILIPRVAAVAPRSRSFRRDRKVPGIKERHADMSSRHVRGQDTIFLILARLGVSFFSLASYA